MQKQASRSTRGTLGSNLTIQSGETVNLYGIIIANTTSSPVTVDVQDAAGAVVMSYRIPADDTKEFQTDILMDGGMVIASVNANIIATVFHSFGGA